jgi:hypothetical protein
VSPSGRGFDIAYGAYGFLGAVALWTARLIFPGSPARGTGAYDAFVAGLGFFVAIPFGLPAVVALIVGCSLSLRLSRDTWLVSLLLATLVFICYLLVWKSLASGWTQWFPMSLYGATCIVSAMGWFLFRRERSPRRLDESVGSSQNDVRSTSSPE